MGIRQGLINLLEKKSINLTTVDRETIFKLFGSFDANALATNPSKQLEEGYESNLDVYSVIKKIVDSSNAVDWIVEEQTSEGWEILEDTSIHELMRNPNRDKGYTWNDISEQLLVYLLASGNGYLTGQDGIVAGLIKEVDVLPSPFVEAFTSNDFFMPNPRFQFDLNNQKRVFDIDEIEHTMFFNPAYTTVKESFNGLSLIQVAALAVQSGNDKWKATAAMNQNRGAMGLITDKSNRPLTEPEGKRLQSSFDKDAGGISNRGRVKVTNKDLNYIQMAMSPTDLQLIEQGVVNLRAICNVFGLDSSLFNDPANKTFNNRKEAEKALYTNAVIPLSNKISAKHTNFLAKNHFPDRNVRMRQDFSNVEALQSDKKQEAEKDKLEMEGINIVLNMPIDNGSKVLMLKETYNISEDLAIALASTNNIGDE